MAIFRRAALIARAGDLRQATPPQPLRAARCATLLAELTGLPVEDVDIKALAERGLVEVVDWYKRWP
ncbi:hypothetical protein [Spongiactinospora sp. 9N601]|uniref:hypothetical protein n=1 Tax=Spongiactinospora sp. 9N601 TaxID=3375149 RepID=UPI0037BA6097